MNESLKLSNPVFIGSVILLFIVHRWFKPVFHNTLTGTISEFAGLLAFPFFLSALFPKQRNRV